MVDQAKLKKFFSQIRAASSIDFPDLARDAGLSWFRDLQPLLETDPEFKAQMEEYLTELRYYLLQIMNKLALYGKQRGKVHDTASIKAMISTIDSGVLLGRAMKDEVVVETIDEERLAEHLKRLGIGGNDEQKT